jgi:hypothetical protein
VLEYGPMTPDKEKVMEWLRGRANRHGWTPPKWWEFYRRADSPRKRDLSDGVMTFEDIAIHRMYTPKKRRRAF